MEMEGLNQVVAEMLNGEYTQEQKEGVKILMKLLQARTINGMGSVARRKTTPEKKLLNLLDFGPIAHTMSQLLHLEDISALDIAMTNKSDRQSWLAFLAGMGVLPTVDNFKHNACSLRWLEARKMRLSKLELRMAEDFNKKVFNDIPAILSQLFSISITAVIDVVTVDDEMLTTMGKYCVELNSLELSCKYETSKANMAQPRFSNRLVGLCRLFEGCKKLRSFSRIFSDTDPIIETLATVPTQLESITLSHFAPPVSNDALHRMFEGQPQLKKFSGVGYGGKNSGGGYQYRINLNKTLNVIVSNCPHLEELRIDGIDDEVGSPALKPFAARCKKLVLIVPELHISDFKAIASSTSITSLSVHLEQIDDFSASMTALGQGCPILTELHVGLCTMHRQNVTAAGLKALTNSPFCSNLEILSFQCRGIDDDAFEYISHFPRVQKLCIYGYFRLNPAFYGENLRKCLSPSLKYLVLHNLSDADLVIIGEVCPLLERVSLYKEDKCERGFSGFSVEPLSQMLQNCPRLRDLEIDNVNDDILKCICSFLPQVEVLRLLSRYEATTASWRAFAKGCQMLRQICFMSNEDPMVDDDHIDEAAVVLLENCPLLESIGDYGRREIERMVKKAKKEKAKKAAKKSAQKQ